MHGNFLLCLEYFTLTSKLSSTSTADDGDANSAAAAKANIIACFILLRVLPYSAANGVCVSRHLKSTGDVVVASGMRISARLFPGCTGDAKEEEEASNNKP